MVPAKQTLSSHSICLSAIIDTENWGVDSITPEILELAITKFPLP
jgi:hypothetical protein